MRRRWVPSLAVAVLLIAVFGVLLWVGPPGQAYRANDAYARCVREAEPLGADGQINREWYAQQLECSRRYCDQIREPSTLQTVGLFFQTRLADEDAFTCVEQPGFGDILPFLPDDDPGMPDGFGRRG